MFLIICLFVCLWLKQGLAQCNAYHDIKGILSVLKTFCYIWFLSSVILTNWFFYALPSTKAVLNRGDVFSSWNLNLSVFVSQNFDEKISCIFISVNHLRVFLVYFAKKWPRPRLFIRFVKILYCSWISKIIMSYVTWTFFCNIMNYWYIFSFRMNINIALIRVFDFGRIIAWVFVSFLDFVTFFIEHFFVWYCLDVWSARFS